MIPWDTIKRAGQQGLLTADQTDALCELGQLAVRLLVHDNGCDVCDAANIFTALQHRDDCAVAVLGAVDDGWKERWEL